MKIIGITGTFGSGKSSAVKMFAELGAYVIDHDKINHEILENGMPGYYALLDEYGTEILDESGDIARSKLAETAFASLESVRRIERILHPIIIAGEEEHVRKFKEEGKYDYIVFDTPLLFETQRDKLCDYTVVITADVAKLKERLKKKFDITDEQIERRISLQMDLEKKAELADFVIDNNGSLEELSVNIKALYDKINDGQ